MEIALKFRLLALDVATMCSYIYLNTLNSRVTMTTTMLYLLKGTVITLV